MLVFLCVLVLFTVCFCLFLDRKNCEGLMEKPLDLGYNAASFMWDPRLGARVSGGEGRGGREGGEREGREREQEGRLRRLLKLLLLLLFVRLYYALIV